MILKPLWKYGSKENFLDNAKKVRLMNSNFIWNHSLVGILPFGTFSIIKRPKFACARKMQDIIPRVTKTVTSQLPNLLRRWTRLLLWMPSKCLEMAWLSSFNWTMAILIFQIHRQKHSRDMINKQFDFRCIKSNSNSWFPRISPRLTQNNAKNSVFAQN